MQSAVPPVKPAAKPVEKLAEKPIEKPLEKVPVPKPAPAKSDTTKLEPAKAEPAKDGAKALALLEGKESFVPPSSPAAPAVAGTPSAGRFVVQVGAFSDAGKVREIRLKLEAAGLKTYTQVVETKEGKRIRVRIGPFDTKADSDKAAAKVKKLDLPVAILEL
ncbi:MAG: hypothetical protein CFE44_17860 [Burkholderiales bacterium PBB4]|nr:MAG: hypothetical protein CFE44_17860 [Burkholderiales bacterium PBB4]